MGRINRITMSGLFLALGTLVPLLFHMIGLGAAFLPMFWPVAVSGVYISGINVWLVGALTPLVSFLLTGMPPPPILYRLVIELIILSVGVNLVYHKTRLGFIWVIAIGLICSMVAGLLGAIVIAPILGLPREFYAVATLIRGIPGYLTILVCIPILLGRLKHESPWKKRTK